MNATTGPDVTIVGGGIAGLSCAHWLISGGVSCQILEASDAVGGRIRTDEMDGFRLDRGFQVLLTTYPEAQRLLDYDALGLRPFYPGALVRVGERFHRIADPWRRPLDALGSLTAPIGTVRDKLTVGVLRMLLGHRRRQQKSVSPQSTQDALEQLGFSHRIVEAFFRPFFGGVFLERELSTPRTMFEFVFDMFARGDISLPARGMAEIPGQIAARLPAGCVRTRVTARTVEPERVVTSDGESIVSRAVVVATDADAAARLCGDMHSGGWNGTVCLYFGAEDPPIREPILVLNGGEGGPVNHLCVPSVVAPEYAPPKWSLVSVSVVGVPDGDGGSLEAGVRRQLEGWFGTAVRGWRHLRTYRIPHALPRDARVRSVRVGSGVYICGDHREQASINGALISGRRAAEAVMKDLG